ncbi:BrnT family toxin [Pseudanabaena biceps]|nr:BrnT family toxin [Pseudanabaena biceps]
MRFEWDANKQQQNQQKHKICFEEATTVWTDPLALVAPDPTHSIIEKREWIIGISYESRVLVVIFTMREKIIRIISARPASKSERKKYAESN